LAAKPGGGIKRFVIFMSVAIIKPNIHIVAQKSRGLENKAILWFPKKPKDNTIYNDGIVWPAHKAFSFILCVRKHAFLKTPFDHYIIQN
jgi:hypothetical protein